MCHRTPRCAAHVGDPSAESFDMSDDARGSAVFGHDVWQDPFSAKGMVGLLPDGLARPERVGVIVLASEFGLLSKANLRQRDRSAATERTYPAAPRTVRASTVTQRRRNHASLA